MGPLVQQLGITVKLHARNKMALIYSYLFPTIFLVAFWVLYRYEQPPLARHLGELLTVTALGGACFGLPTTMVSERERGVWRRYRLAPVRTESLVGGTVIARYGLLIAAALVQVALAMAIGMPLPRHPFDLFVAFTCVAFAFIGLGLVIAMMADNVPAVQALGQCIFLPMLILGGVAVPLAALPDWAQRMSAFFPGRYAVEALQASATGNGLGEARFSVVALLLIGSAGCVAGAKMFRWDAQQRFAATPGKAWVAVALVAWAAVGVMAESQGRSTRSTRASNDASTAPAVTPQTPVESTPAPAPPPSTPAAPPAAVSVPVEKLPATNAAPDTKPAPKTAAPVSTAPTPPAVVPVPSLPKSEPAPSTSPAPPAPAKPPAAADPWRGVTIKDIDRDLIFSRLPPDSGVVTPIAALDDEPDDEAAGQLEQIRAGLADWKPGKVQDPVQRVRNVLYVAAVVDVFQMEGLERFLPRVVFDRLQADVPREDLMKILYWIALHPMEGDDTAVDELRPLGLGNGPGDMKTTRDRVAVYAVKLLGRMLGRIKAE